MDKQLPAINNDPIVGEYLSLLFDHGYKNEHHETRELLEYIEQMEKQYSLIVEELHEVKELINHLQNPVTQSRMSVVVGKVETAVNDSLNKLNTLKLKLTNSMKESINSFKQKGKNKVIKTINVLHFKEILGGIRNSLFAGMKQTKSLIHTCDAMTSEMRQAKTHLKQVRQIVFKKDQTINNQDKQKMNLLQKVSRKVYTSLEKMTINTTSLLHKLEDFEKPSVKKEIKLIENKTLNKTSKKKHIIKQR